MKISVCMIVLNEEESLERILSLVKLFADEIIVVDTGSKDKTVQIAKAFTDKIYTFDWVDDFSKARNYAFSKATQDYVMWLDADDFISRESLDKILRLKESVACADTYMFKYSCVDTNGNQVLTFYRERLLKKCNKCLFKGFIHEAIIPFGKIEYTDIEIEHRKVKKVDLKRNLNIYRKHKFKDLSSRDKYYCAKEYYYNGYYKSAEERLKAYLKDGDFLPNVYDAYITLYECSVKTNDNKAIKYLLKCVEKCGLTSEVLCKIGDEFLNKNEALKAIECYKCALSCQKPENSLFFIKNEYYYLYPLLQLTFVYFKAGDIENSLKYHRLSLLDSPKDHRVVKNQEFFNSYSK